jgi:hypothetical protein
MMRHAIFRSSDNRLFKPSRAHAHSGCYFCEVAKVCFERGRVKANSQSAFATSCAAQIGREMETREVARHQFRARNLQKKPRRSGGFCILRSTINHASSATFVASNRDSGYLALNRLCTQCNHPKPGLQSTDTAAGLYKAFGLQATCDAAIHKEEYLDRKRYEQRSRFF